MKKRLFIGFAILTACLVTGGFYVTLSVGEVITKLEDIITLHQVEILRKNLLAKIEVVQRDLLLKDTPHSTDIAVFLQHGEEMADELESCFDCHHVDPAKTRLEGLQIQVEVYKTALSRVYTTRASPERMTVDKQVAFHIGKQVTREVHGIIETSSEKLAERTESALEGIERTRRLIAALVVAGPALGMVIALFFARDLTSSVATLINATRRLKSGELDHKIEGLKDEFGELGDSFNEMAVSLTDVIRRVEDSERRYRMLFEAAGDAIFMLEAEGENVGRIVSANQAAADMHGYTVAELLEMNIMDLDTPEAAMESPDRVRRMLAGEWIHVEITNRKKDGTVIPIEISGGLLEFEDQKFILAFDKDITERKQAEEALQRTEQLVVVGEMAAGLAHEIKNPLAGIKVSIEVLTSELKLEPEDSEVFRRIIDEINRIETLLKNLLSYAMPPTPQFELIDVNRIIEAAIKAAAFSLKSPAQKTKSRKIKDIRFVEALSDRLPEIVADAAQLQQVLLNLLLNAIHAIRETGSISLETSSDSDGFIRIVVSDTGKGINDEDLGKIFMPFFTTKPKGTGLGLPICKRLIEQQNGSIDVAQNATGGLMFSISLPVDQAGVG